MQAPNRPDSSSIAGFAVGVGLVSVATVGVYWHFWQPASSPWAWGLGSFALGALAGAVVALLRRERT
jgi:hypothetical protein